MAEEVAHSLSAHSPHSPAVYGHKFHADDPLLNFGYEATHTHGTRLHGKELVNEPWLNKGTAFTAAERERLGLRGLLPPRIMNEEAQVQRLMREYEAPNEVMVRGDPSSAGVTPDMIRRSKVLMELQNRNETLYYKILLRHFKAMAPIIYTPTVGWSCQHMAETFRRPRGMYFSAEDRGEMATMLPNWPAEKVDAIVVTDGSRILGLGDLGVSGMGISIGKLNCYVAAAGFHPSRVLPVCLDVGTNNEEFIQDPLYLGLQHRRLTGKAYVELVDEFLAVVTARWPGVLVQFEDFSYDNAKMLLDRYRAHRLVFNDDIQGTAATALAGVYGALAVQGRPPSDIVLLRFVVAGAGSAGMGVIDQLQRAMVKHGLPEEEACRHFWVCDVGGLITQQREHLPEHVQKFARPEVELEGAPLADAARAAKATGLIGLSGVGQLFSMELMTEVGNSAEAEGFAPLIFPLSNPTSKSETTPQQAQEATGGKAIVATGSPFPDVEFDGRSLKSNQGNNIYIFPGLALGAVLSGTPYVTDGMLMTASEALVELIPPEGLERGQCFPDLSDPRGISAHVAMAVMKMARDEGLASADAVEIMAQGDEALRKYIRSEMYIPEYQHLYPLRAAEV